MMDQPFVFFPAPFDHPSTTTSFSVAIGEQKFPITALPNGDRPKFILLSSGNATGFAVALGDSTIDASTDPQYYVNEDMSMMLFDVLGMTHVSVNSTVTGALTMSILGNY